MSKQHDRYALYFLACIGVAIFTVGIWDVRSSFFVYRDDIILPVQQAVAAQLAQASSDASGTLGTTSEAARIAELQKKDTDGDSINDFDEQYVYGTSAYLKDSDSDGKPDKEEVDAGENPLCADDQQCAPAPVSTASTQTQISAAALDAFASLNPTGVNANKAQEEQLAQISQNPAALREFLKSKGVKDEVLNSTDDATLLQLAKDAISVSQGTATQATDPQTAIVRQADQIKNQTAAEKRTFLINAGASQKDVEKLTDAQVTALLSETVDQALKAYTLPGELINAGFTANTNQ